MRGATAARRIGGTVAIATALAGAAAGTASAMAINGPGCVARVVPVVSPSSSCGFDSPTDWAMITVEPVGGSVTATVTCRDQYGHTRTSTRSVSERSSWSTSAYGTCSLTLTSTGAVSAVGTATPTLRIYPTP